MLIVRSVNESKVNILLRNEILWASTNDVIWEAERVFLNWMITHMIMIICEKQRGRDARADVREWQF